ncbi:MAG: DUF3500 domain-containing protein [Gemmatimonadota bacterium]|nr:DUF3500 domain-containing protein [Gemmatimonadota bacterium]
MISRALRLRPLLALAALVLVGASVPGAARVADTARAMTGAARTFLAGLDGDERARATWSLDDEARFDWHFVPREREGLPLEDMSAGQRADAHALLGSVLSSRGYLKATGAMQLEGILGEIEGRPERRDPDDYYVSIFGAPSADEPWAWRFEGHHLSLSFTSVPGAIPAVTPSFIGSNPHVVGEGPYAGWSLLGAEEKLARELLGLLDHEQRSRAIIAAEAPSDIVTGNARRVELEGYEGLPASDMRDDQRQALLRLLGEYLHNAAHDIAAGEMERLHEAGLDRLHFAWAGGTEPGEGHYYRIHGPTVLIEYDNVQGGANHVHSVWRDPQNDFGDDLLRRHYEEADHHQP